MKQCVSSGSPFEREIGFSRAVRVGDTVWVSATAAIWPDGHVEAVGAAHGRAFGEVRPATGVILVSGFIDPRWKVEIEADAVVG